MENLRVKTTINILKSKWLFTFVSLLLFIGLFVLKSDLAETRLEKEIWNLGHLFGFLILWLFMINLFPVFYPDSIRRVGLVFLIML
ncbi:hypothetical protein MNBD_GAMMA21-468, partial [hydrothermal vent metagenome]